MGRRGNASVTTLIPDAVPSLLLKESAHHLQNKHKLNPARSAGEVTRESVIRLVLAMPHLRSLTRLLHSGAWVTLAPGEWTGGGQKFSFWESPDSPCVWMGTSMGPVRTAGKSVLGRGLALSCKLQRRGSYPSLDGNGGKRCRIAWAARLRSGQCLLLHDGNLGLGSQHSDNWRGVDAGTGSESDVRQVNASRSFLEWVTGHRSRDVFLCVSRLLPILTLIFASVLF